MIRPRVFLWTLLVLAVIAIACYLFVPKGIFMVLSAGKKSRTEKTVAVVFVDISKSDTARTWLKENYTAHFKEVVNNVFRSGKDVLAVYLLHGRTIDATPFWTNAPLSGHRTVQFPEESDASLAMLWREQCLRSFDSVMSLSYTGKFDPMDSVQLELTDILGAVEQAGLYFRFSATASSVNKQIYFLSDMRENAGRINESIKTEGLNTINTAEAKAAEAAKEFIQATTIAKELKHTDIFIKSPLNRLFISHDRNRRRMFWETFFINYLGCRNVYYQ